MSIYRIRVCLSPVLALLLLSSCGGSADPTFISTYARDFPSREDIAESFLPYLAIRYRADRISQSLANTILLTIPNRIAYFDDQSFAIYPIE